MIEVLPFIVWGSLGIYVIRGLVKTWQRFKAGEP